MVSTEPADPDGGSEPPAGGTARAEAQARPPAAAEAGDDRDASLRRALADLDNLRKRFTREVTRERELERRAVAKQWVAVLDNLERALEHAGGDCPGLTDGVRAVSEQAQEIMKRLGYPRFDDTGKVFDPARHEALGTARSEIPAGRILGVVHAGYGTSEDILRPAGVMVSKGP
jgi:molecular chaperone GrpE